MIPINIIDQLKESWMKIYSTNVLNEWEFWDYTIAITKEVQKIKEESLTLFYLKDDKGISKD